MKHNLNIFFLILFFYSSNLSENIFAQTNEIKRGNQQKELPQIQMEDYTIIGLARVTLPQKSRKQTFKDIKVRWIKNQKIYQKEYPSITFKFSRSKLSPYRLYDFPWLSSSIHYGSYNTSGIFINTQFQANHTLPYLTADHNRSDGHTDNSQWTSSGLQAGIHQMLSKGHLLHLGTEYEFTTRGIWKDWEKYNEKWETETVLWNIMGSLEQQWSHHFQNAFNGVFYLDDHKNGFKYSEQGFDAEFNIKGHFSDTEIEVGINYQQTKLSSSNGNLEKLPPSLKQFEKFKGSIISGTSELKQKFGITTIGIGLVYQESEEITTTSVEDDFKKSKVHPNVTLLFEFSGIGKIYFRYRPITEIHRFRQNIRNNPFSEISYIRLVNYKSRFETGIDLKLMKDLDLKFSGSHYRAENFPAIVAPSDSLNAELNLGGYPGWIFSILPQVIVQDLMVKVDWEIHRGLNLSGWINLRQSQIHEVGNYPEEIKDNKIPYYPELTAYGKIKWYFYKKHSIQISSHYTDKRYDDLFNNNLLSDYLLFGATVDLALHPNIGLYISGQNLFDVKYEEWQGFNGTGIAGTFGMRIKM
jgi:hypothetical protein